MGPADIVVIITTNRGGAQAYLWQSTDYGQKQKAIEWACDQFREDERYSQANSDKEYEEDPKPFDEGKYERYFAADIVSIQAADVFDRYLGREARQ